MDKNCLPEKENKLSPRSFIIKLSILSIIVLAAIITCSFFGVLVHSFFADKQQWVDIAKEHASAAIGLPIATIVAIMLVSILQVTTGKIEFEGLGFKFRGASGPVVLWIACFIVLVIGIKLLW